MPGTGALLLLVFASLVVVVLLVLMQLTRLGFLIRTTIPDRPRRRMFIASVSFLITFLGVRLLVSLVIHQHGPFEWVMVRGRHIHHLVWGILILLFVGYGWLLDRAAIARTRIHLFGTGSRIRQLRRQRASHPRQIRPLKLSLEPDAYWSSAGRLSIDAVILFGSILAVGAWGAPFFRALQRLWAKRVISRRELGQPQTPIRRVRCFVGVKCGDPPRHTSQ